MSSSLAALIATYVDPEQDDAAQEQAFSILQQRIIVGDDSALQPASSSSSASSATSSASFDTVMSNAEHESDPAFLSLQQLIGRMEGPLTTPDDKTRHRATLLLAELLHVVKGHPVGQGDAVAHLDKRARTTPDDLDVDGAGGVSVSMPPAALHLLLVFFLHRLGDYPSLLPALHALSALISRFGHCLDRKYCDCEDLVSSIHRQLHVAALAQSVRSRYYALMLLLLKEGTMPLAHIQALSADKQIAFAASVIAAGEGEKDPRCLLLYFQLLHVVQRALIEPSPSIGGANFAAAAVLESILAAVGTYFPITFRPPANDPYGITHELLVARLRDALLGGRLMVPLALKFVAEQLHGDTDYHLSQATQVLTHAVQAFGLAAVAATVDPSLEDAGGASASASASAYIVPGGTGLLGAIARRLYAVVTDSEKGDALMDPATVTSILTDPAFFMEAPPALALQALLVLQREIETLSRGGEQERAVFVNLWLQISLPVVTLASSQLGQGSGSVAGHCTAHVVVAFASAGCHGRLLAIDSCFPSALARLRRLWERGQGEGSGQAEAMATLNLLLRLVLQVPLVLGAIEAADEAALDASPNDGPGGKSSSLHHPLSHRAAELVSVLGMVLGQRFQSSTASASSGGHDHGHEHHELQENGAGREGEGKDEAADEGKSEGGCCGGGGGGGERSDHQHDHQHGGGCCDGHSHAHTTSTNAASDAPSGTASASDGPSPARLALTLVSAQALTALLMRTREPALGGVLAWLVRILVYGQHLLGTMGATDKEDTNSEDSLFLSSDVSSQLDAKLGYRDPSALMAAAAAGLVMLAGKHPTAASALLKALVEGTRHKAQGRGSELAEAVGGMRVLGLVGCGTEALLGPAIEMLLDLATSSAELEVVVGAVAAVSGMLDMGSGSGLGVGNARVASVLASTQADMEKGSPLYRLVAGIRQSVAAYSSIDTSALVTALGGCISKTILALNTSTEIAVSLPIALLALLNSDTSESASVNFTLMLTLSALQYSPPGSPLFSDPVAGAAVAAVCTAVGECGSGSVSTDVLGHLVLVLANKLSAGSSANSLDAPLYRLLAAVLTAAERAASARSNAGAGASASANTVDTAMSLLVYAARGLAMRAPIPDANTNSTWQHRYYAAVTSVITINSASSAALSLASRLHLLTADGVLPPPVSFLSSNSSGSRGGSGSSGASGRELTAVMFWRQKLFTALQTGLVAALRGAGLDKTGRSGEGSHGRKVTLLVAICSLCRHIPLSMVPAEAAQPVVDPAQAPLTRQELAAAVVELLLATVNTSPHADTTSTSTDVTALNVALSLLQTLTLASSGNDSATPSDTSASPLLPHVTSLVPLLVTVAQLSVSANRALALKTLLALSDLPFPRIFPVRHTVVRGLARVCDDNKRSLRLLAARVRNRWAILEEGRK